MRAGTNSDLVNSTKIEQKFSLEVRVLFEGGYKYIAGTNNKITVGKL